MQITFDAMFFKAYCDSEVIVQTCICVNFKEQNRDKMGFKPRTTDSEVRYDFER